MKILFIINNDTFFKSHFLHIAQALVENGHEVHLATNFIEMPIDKLICHKLDIHRSSKGIFSEVFTFYQLLKLIFKLRPNIVHSFTIKPVLYVGFISRFYFGDVKFIYTITGMGSVFLKGGLYYKFIKKIIGLFYKFSFNNRNTSVVFENCDDMQFFISEDYVNTSKCYIVNGAGVDLDLFLVENRSYNDHKLVFSFVARLLRDKGIFEFLECARRCNNLRYPAKFLVVGDFDENNPSAISPEELNDYRELTNVSFLGFCKDIHLIYKNSNVAVLPSYREGLPKSLIEAAASSLPIITTDVPGCRQMVPSPQHGYLVLPRSADSLFQAIKDCIFNRNILQSIGESNRERAVMYFSYKAVFDQYKKIYFL